jgi:His-Xaa-Ser system protein HxsD
VIRKIDGIEIQSEAEQSATIYLEPRVFSREAILKASYWYTDVAYIQISPSSSDDRFVVNITLKQHLPTLAEPSPIKMSELIGEYCNSLLDFELRRHVEVETAEVRQLIVAKAFSESGILEDDPPGEVADPVEISKPSSLLQIIKRNLK